MKKVKIASGYFYILSIIIFFIISCSNNKQQENEQAEKDSVATADKPVDTSTPIASFSSNTNDVQTDNDFVVKVYPTQTAQLYKLSIKYGKNQVEDSESIPPAPIAEKAALRVGNTSDDCLFGFVNKKGEFKEMKRITGSRTAINIKSLKAYIIRYKEQ